jgi:hypothetical protein
MERPAYNNFPKNRNGPRYGGRNRECQDTSRRIICKLRGERYCNPSNKWLAKFIQEQLFTFDYEVAGVGIATLIFRYFLRYFSSTHRTDLSRFREDLGGRDDPRTFCQNWSSLSQANSRNHLNTAPYIWPWKGPHIANYGVSAIAIRAMNGWQNSFRNNCSLSITGRPPRGTQRRENSHR